MNTIETHNTKESQESANKDNNGMSQTMNQGGKDNTPTVKEKDYGDWMIVSRRKRNPKDKGKGRDPKDNSKPRSSPRNETKKDETSTTG